MPLYYALDAIKRLSPLMMPAPSAYGSPLSFRGEGRLGLTMRAILRAMAQFAHDEASLFSATAGRLSLHAAASTTSYLPAELIDERASYAPD